MDRIHICELFFFRLLEVFENVDFAKIEPDATFFLLQHTTRDLRLLGAEEAAALRCRFRRFFYRWGLHKGPLDGVPASPFGLAPAASEVRSSFAFARHCLHLSDVWTA